MKRLNKLLSSPEYKTYLGQIETAEADRKFCRHGIPHFYDVSRILYIYCLENGLKTDKELIYAIGFLHDIGRARQYTDGTEHHRASADIVAELMPRYGFDAKETEFVLKAVASHRDTENNDLLCALVYKADKKSRACFACPAVKECNWDAEKMNTEIEI